MKKLISLILLISMFAFSALALEIDNDANDAVDLANGGTNSILSDPGADRILFWDDSAGVVTWLILGDYLAVTTTTLDVSGLEVADAAIVKSDVAETITEAWTFTEGLNAGSSATPSITFLDSGNPGTDKEIAKFSANYIDGGDGAENGDAFLQAMQGGSEVTFLQFDESDDQIELKKDLNVETHAIKTTGLLSGGVVTKTTAANYTVGTTNAAESYGGIIYVTSACTVTLEAIANGMSVTVITIGAIAVSVDTNASDKMVLDGVTLDDGDKATNTATTGDIIVFTYYSADGWYATSNSWTDGGA